MSEQERELTLQDYQRAVIRVTCHWDGAELGPVEHFDHSGGFKVKGYAERQWLYAKCLKCGYDWALWKLVDREESLMPTDYAEKIIKARVEAADKSTIPDETGLTMLANALKAPREKVKKALEELNSKPWKGICCKSCWFARKKPCRCRCKKANHQRGIQKKVDDFIEGMKMVGPVTGLANISLEEKTNGE